MDRGCGTGRSVARWRTDGTGRNLPPVSTVVPLAAVPFRHFHGIQSCLAYIVMLGFGWVCR